MVEVPGCYSWLAAVHCRLSCESDPIYIVPAALTKKFIKDSRFTTGFYIATGTVLYLIYFLVILILALVFAGWKGLLIALAVPVSGYLVLYYQEIFRERMNSARFRIKSIKTSPLSPI